MRERDALPTRFLLDCKLTGLLGVRGASCSLYDALEFLLALEVLLVFELLALEAGLPLPLPLPVALLLFL